MKELKMIINIGIFERVIRVVGGAAIVSLAFWGPQSFWFLLGVIPMFTGLVGWCPLYHFMNISTCKTK
jgi:hypothetical protein